jgi:energy-converting hydrogenase Eha subunit H
MLIFPPPSRVQHYSQVVLTFRFNYKLVIFFSILPFFGYAALSRSATGAYNGDDQAQNRICYAIEKVITLWYSLVRELQHCWR